MDKEEIKEFIKDNLEITTDYGGMCEDSGQSVGLKFIGDTEPFTYISIYLD